VIACYLFVDLMLVDDRFQLFLIITLRYFDDFQSIDVIGLSATNHIHFSKGSLSQKFKNLKIYFKLNVLDREILIGS